jgi:hypothetical protein
MSSKMFAGALAALATVALVPNAKAASITVGWWNQSDAASGVQTVYTQTGFAMTLSSSSPIRPPAK